nr:unnamed protein product [Callosobruchus chinensis]
MPLNPYAGLFWSIYPDPVSDVDQECTIFSGVTYLGAAAINAPKSEAEIQRNMAILNEQSMEQGIKVSISVPSSSQGLVVSNAYCSTLAVKWKVQKRDALPSLGLTETPKNQPFSSAMCSDAISQKLYPEFRPVLPRLFKGCLDQ